jgi:beta-aspartyl-peptidase (threonine type)
LPLRGAVAAARRCNPVEARAVMDGSSHVLLVGEGADEFAAHCALPLADPEWFITHARREQWERIKKAEARELEGRTHWEVERLTDPVGTVGAVALDRFGNLAAATSTGGIANKRYGRVGDSPIIGSGTYADNATCAVSCQRGGFLAVAPRGLGAMGYRGMSLNDATPSSARPLPALAAGELVAVAGWGTGALEHAGHDRGCVRAARFHSIFEIQVPRTETVPRTGTGE